MLLQMIIVIVIIHQAITMTVNIKSNTVFIIFIINALNL